MQKYTVVYLCTRLNDFLLDVRCQRGNHWATLDYQQRGGTNTHRRRGKPEMRLGRTDNSSSNLRVRRQLYSGMSISCFHLPGFTCASEYTWVQGRYADFRFYQYLPRRRRSLFRLCIPAADLNSPRTCAASVSFTFGLYTTPVIAVLLEEWGTCTQPELEKGCDVMRAKGMIRWARIRWAMVSSHSSILLSILTPRERVGR